MTEISILLQIIVLLQMQIAVLQEQQIAAPANPAPIVEPLICRETSSTTTDCRKQEQKCRFERSNIWDKFTWVCRDIYQETE